MREKTETRKRSGNVWSWCVVLVNWTGFHYVGGPKAFELIHKVDQLDYLYESELAYFNFLFCSIDHFKPRGQFIVMSAIDSHCMTLGISLNTSIVSGLILANWT